MSWFGIVFISVFSANAFLVYGLGSHEALREQHTRSWSTTLALLLANFVASALLWLAHNLVLDPLGLEKLEVVFFALVIVPLMKYLSQLAMPVEGRRGRAFFSAIDDATLSCLVFGIALIGSHSGYDLSDALLASIASALGYSAALVLLDAIQRRLELSDLPRALRDGPAMLLSAGLLAMAFSGIDGYLVANLVK